MVCKINFTIKMVFWSKKSEARIIDGIMIYHSMARKQH